MLVHGRSSVHNSDIVPQGDGHFH
jgi:hypothetical protein